LFFGGDFNSHNIVWDSANTCHTGGRSLWETIDGSDLSLLDDGSFTFHCVSYHTNSVIDLTVTNALLALVLNWYVGPGMLIHGVVITCLLSLRPKTSRIIELGIEKFCVYTLGTQTGNFFVT